MTRWFAVAGSLALVAMFLATRRPAFKPLPSQQPAVAPVRPLVQIVTGQIEARHTITVELAEPIPIGEFLADVGQNVVEGQILARLATSTTTVATATSLIAAEAKAAAARTAVSEAKLEVAKEKADAQRAKEQSAQARVIFEREKKLMEVGATPRKTFERTQQEFEAAQAESVKAEEAWRQTENLSYAAADRLRDASAELAAANRLDAQARATLAAAELHAPATGMVVWRKGPEDGKEIFRIAVNLDQLQAVFTVEKVKQGDDVLIAVPGTNIAPFHAVVSALADAQAVAEFTSPNPSIRPGAQCTVTIQLK